MDDVERARLALSAKLVERDLDGFKETAFRYRHTIIAALTPCTVPPVGWFCTRDAGHEGPCAAVPSSGHIIEGAVVNLKQKHAKDCDWHVDQNPHECNCELKEKNNG